MARLAVNKKKRAPMSFSGNTYTRSKTRKPSNRKFPNLWPWVLTLFTSFLFVVILSVALLYLYRFFTVSEYFAVKDVQVAGNVRLGSAEIQKLAEISPGMNSLAVRMGAVENRLLDNPWIAGVSVKRELPGSFYITVRERVPHYWGRQNDKVVYLDSRGDTICELEPAKFTSLPFLSVDPGMELWLGQLPDMVGSLETASLPLDVNNAAWVRLSRSGGMELFLENADMTLGIGVEDWTTNLNRLALVLGDLSRRGELKYVRSVKVDGDSVWVEAARSPAADR
ncbi:MAG: cell division protein FtsQ/DivIB [Halodesulfovibrio sp.]